MYFHKKKFQKFESNKKIKVLLDLISQIEKEWNNLDLREKSYNNLLELAKVFCDEFPDKILFHSIKLKQTKKEFIEMIVPIEREFSHKILKDEHFIILKKDGERTKIRKNPIFLILNNLRSTFNIGSIIRTSECFGIYKIFFCGYTATPNHPKVKKISMGTYSQIEWEYVEKIEDVISRMKKKKIEIIALETTTDAENLSNFIIPKPVCLILGNEALGINAKVLKMADRIVQIPLYGWKNSLNVANAFSIVAYECIRQWNISEK